SAASAGSSPSRARRRRSWSSFPAGSDIVGAPEEISGNRPWLSTGAGDFFWRRVGSFRRPGHPGPDSSATAGIGVARDRAGLVGAACDRRVGVLREQTGGRREDRGHDTAMEKAGLVVLAVLDRVAVGCLRRERGAVSPELHRGPRRADEGPRPPPAVRRPRPAALG